MTAPTPMDVQGIFGAVQNHAMTVGLFETVNNHESMAPSMNGIHYEVFCGPIGPVRAGSGLNITSALVVIMGRIKINLNRGSRETVETDLLYAVDRMLNEYTGQFQLGLSDVRAVDVLGMSGTALSARPGYISQDNHLFRIADITIPIIVQDAWLQQP